MADLPFWQQFILSGTQGLVAAGVVVWAGSRYFRQQERIRREEDLVGSLARLRQDSLVEALHALGELSDFRNEYLATLDAYEGNTDDPRVKSAGERCYAKWEATQRLLMSKRFLIPGDLHETVVRAALEVAEAGSEAEAHKALDAVETELTPYFSALTRR